MARPRKYFGELEPAEEMARKKGHGLWRFVHGGYLGTGYFVGERLPQKILITRALVTKIDLRRLDAERRK